MSSLLDYPEEINVACSTRPRQQACVFCALWACLHMEWRSNFLVWIAYRHVAYGLCWGFFVPGRIEQNKIEWMCISRTHWDLRGRHFNGAPFCWMESVIFCFTFHWNFLQGLLDNMPVMIHWMAWCLCDKPWPEPIMTKFHYAMWRHYTS